MTEMLDLFDKDFKVAMLNMLQNMLETNVKIESLGKETEDVKKSQMKIWELKIQNSADGFSSRTEETEERFSELEDGTIVIESK